MADEKEKDSGTDVEFRNDSRNPMAFYDVAGVVHTAPVGGSVKFKADKHTAARVKALTESQKGMAEQRAEEQKRAEAAEKAAQEAQERAGRERPRT